MAAGQEPDNDAVFADPMLRLPLGRIMGIDYGQRRIGISLCDPTQTIASPLTTLLYRNDDRLGKELSHLVEMHHIIAMVVGWPLNMNGSEGEKTAFVEKFVQLLAGLFIIPVFVWDERWTTVSAQRALLQQGVSPSRNKERVDAVASAFILDAFLHRLDLLRKSQPLKE